LEENADNGESGTKGDNILSTRIKMNRTQKLAEIIDEGEKQK